MDISIGDIVSIITLALLLYHIGFNWGKYKERVDENVKRIDKIEDRQDQLYDIVFARGKYEGRGKGIIREHSPMRVVQEILMEHPDLEQELKDWYSKNGSGMSKVDLAAELQKNFGAQLAQFASHYGLGPEAGIVAGMYICTGVMP